MLVIPDLFHYDYYTLHFSLFILLLFTKKERQSNYIKPKDLSTIGVTLIIHLFTLGVFHINVG